jgi:hypothetical protein
MVQWRLENALTRGPPASPFDVQRSMFDVQRSMFDVQRSMFGPMGSLANPAFARFHKLNQVQNLRQLRQFLFNLRQRIRNRQPLAK